MMQNDDLEKLLDKYRQGICTPEERAFVESWYLSYEDDPAIPITEPDRINDLDEVWDRLSIAPERKRYVLWPRIAAAAVVLITVGIGVLYYNNKAKIEDRFQIVSNDVNPGGNKAYLTLGNGKRITLTGADNGAIANQSNVQITKAADGQLVYTVSDSKAQTALLEYNTIETPNGGKYEIRLPDGTKVWINSASSLKYPTSFASLKERKVELKGEAYFEVAHNKSLPFKVFSAGQTVEVLGTHFNINSYIDESVVRTTLLEGSVKVSQVDNNNFRFLKPGQQSTYRDKGLQVAPADTEQAVAWKNGDFVFNGEDVKTVMRQIARWYDVDVEYSGNLSDIGFVSTISRSKNLSGVLKALEKTQGVHFKIEGRRILVMP